MRVDPRATERLLVRLGLSTRSTKQAREGQVEDQEGEKSAPAPPSRRKRVGQRNPTRDEVKKEAEADG